LIGVEDATNDFIAAKADNNAQAKRQYVLRARVGFAGNAFAFRTGVIDPRLDASLYRHEENQHDKALDRRGRDSRGSAAWRLQ
jgi:hypothetical protein